MGHYEECCEMDVEEKEEKNALIIFEENLTADGLDEIIEESKSWPVSAQNRTDYDLVYEQHQRFKRLELACRKKAKELEKEEKTRSKTHIGKIKKDLEFVQGILNPLILKLGNSRQRYDDETEAYKENRAFEAAQVQRAEHERQQKLREDQKRAFEEESKKLADKRDKLKRAWYEFECEKSRLDFEDAYNISFADSNQHKVVNDEYADKPVTEYGPNGSSSESKPAEFINYPKTDDVKLCKSIKKATTEHIAILEALLENNIKRPMIKTRLGELIARLKVVLQIFVDAVNN